jgi:hypothetical protein
MNQKIIKEKVSRRAVEIVKERVYVDSREEAPGEVQVQQGEQGGLWYESSEVEGEAEEDVEWVETEYGEVPDTDGPIPPDMRDEPIGSDSHPVLWKRPEGEEETEEYINEIQDTEWYGEGSEIFQRAFNGPENTENYHTDEDGNWDEERLEKHEEWSEELLNEDAAVDDDEEPIGMILLGPPGAGKGWWQEQVEEGEYGETGEFVEREFTAISSDRTKEPIPEYEETNASEVHDEASKMAKENLAPRAMEERHNVIIDKVATSPGSTLDMVDTMREQGYDVRANFVNVPTGKSIHNAVSRYFEEGRFTPLDFANGAVEQSRESFNTILDETEIPDEKVGRFDNDVEWGNAPEAEFVGEELLKEFLDVLQKYKRDPVEAENGGKDERKTRPGRDRSGDSGMDGGRLRSLPGGRNGGSRDGRVSKRKLVLAAESILEDSSEDFSDGWVVGKEWVNDPTEEAPNRWTNTETGEYRYQESKPSPGSGSSQNQESDEASGQEIDPDDYRTVALGEVDIEEGTLLDFGDEALEVETVVNDPSATFGPNAGYVQLSDGTYANLMGDKPGNGGMEDIPGDEIRAFTEADALVEEDPETAGTADVDDWSVDWDGVQYNNSGTERGGRDLIRLDEKQKRRFRNEWEDAAPDDGVEVVSSTMRAIKGSTMTTDGQFYDKLFKETFGVEGEPRSGDFEEADVPSDEAAEAMRVFTEASQQFARENWGEEIDLYRGMGTHSTESVVSQLEEFFVSDADEKVELRDNPASVWTADEKMSRSFGEYLNAKETVTPDEVLATPEALIDFSSSRGPDWNEGEVNISGWDREMSLDDFELQESGIGLKSAITSPYEAREQKERGSHPVTTLARMLRDYKASEAASQLKKKIQSHEDYDEGLWVSTVDALEEAERAESKASEDEVVDVRMDGDWLSEAAREFREEDKKEKLADNFIENLLKSRVYVDDPTEAPEGVSVQEGEEGGTYYETEGGSEESQETSSGWQESPEDFSELGEGQEVLIEAGGEELTGEVISVSDNGNMVYADTEEYGRLRISAKKDVKEIVGVRGEADEAVESETLEDTMSVEEVVEEVDVGVTPEAKAEKGAELLVEGKVDAETFAIAADKAGFVRDHRRVAKDAEFHNEELGIDISYQLKRFKEETEKLEEKYKQDFDSESYTDVLQMADSWQGPMFVPATAGIFQYAASVTGNEQAPSSGSDGPFSDEARESRLEAAENIHEFTTEVLRETFGDTVTVFRGVASGGGLGLGEAEEGDDDRIEQMREAVENGEDVVKENRTLESWTTSAEYADRYAGDNDGTIFRREVPVEKVLMASHGGQLGSGENEFIVMEDEETTYSNEDVILPDNLSQQDFMELQAEAVIDTAADKNTDEEKMSKDSFKLGVETDNPHWLHTTADEQEGEDEDGGEKALVKNTIISAAESVLKGRVYVDSPEEAPEGVNVQEGQEGGTYYVSGDEEETSEPDVSFEGYSDLEEGMEIELFGEEAQVVNIDEFGGGDVVDIEYENERETTLEEDRIREILETGEMEVTGSGEVDESGEADDEIEVTDDMEELIQDVTDSFDMEPKEINSGRCMDWAYEVEENFDGDAQVVETAPALGAENAHWFVEHDGKYYDAESPDGVDDWRELDIWDRAINLPDLDEYSVEGDGLVDSGESGQGEVGGGQSSKEGVDFDVPVIDLSDDVETVSQQIEEHPAVKSSSIQEHDGEEYADFIVHSTYGDEAHGDYIVEDYAGVSVERVGRVGGDPVYAFDPPEGVEFQDVAGGGNPFEQMVDKAIERIFSKDRVYVDSPEEAPDGVNVQEGEEGGTYYETGSSDEQDSDEIAPGEEVTIENFGEEQDVEIIDPNLPGGILVEDEDGNQFSVGEGEIVGRESDSQDMLDGIMDDFESVDEDEDDEDEVMSGEERRELFEDMMDDIPELPEEPDGDEPVQGVETDVSEFSGGDRVVSEEDIEAVSETLSDGSLLGLSMEMRDVESEEDYGPFEPSTGIALYDGDNSKYAHTDIVMDTDDFSNLQAQIHEEYSDVDRVRHFGSAEAERVEEYAESMESGEKFPMPHIVMNDEGQVVNEQEGRHRALAALEAGVQELPVRVVVEPGRNTKTYKLKREVLHKIGWIPLASESPDPERERVDADWNEVEDEEELADKFVKRVLEKYRIYVDSPSDAPEGALCREGPSGAWFYYSNQTQSNSPTRVYISSPDDAPEECTVRGGPSGGYYYYSHEHPRGQV